MKKEEMLYWFIGKSLFFWNGIKHLLPEENIDAKGNSSVHKVFYLELQNSA